MEKNFINARIKELRKSLKLNQAEFGERIGLKTSAISKMEQEGSTVVDQNISLICEKFNVRREWLMEGAGKMLQETEDSLFASFAERYHLDQGEQNLARYLLRLTSEERQMVKKHILSMAAALQATSKEAAKPKAAAPAQEPHALTEDEWDMVQRHRTAKDGNSTEDGSLDTGA